MIWYKYLYLGETAKSIVFDSTETPPRKGTAGRSRDHACLGRTQPA